MRTILSVITSVTFFAPVGLSQALIKRYQDIAQQERLPIWLEATTRYSSQVYAKLGFETVEEIVLGKGVAAGDGTKKKGGEGVKIWGMIWRPPNTAI